ncbi:MAG: DNA topoisomerase IV subunit A [Rhodocyclaceae bacterium]|nr:DNA topoisomerase IV subunit A [Rhodocyclaceae bacterium]
MTKPKDPTLDMFADPPAESGPGATPIPAAPAAAAAESRADTPEAALAQAAPPGGEPPDAALPDLPEDRLPIALFAERAYLAYAMSVVKSRALPQVEDGQKPVQRRILFAMREMRLGASSKHVKSARVVGDVIGKYHPHGDSSVYDAAVRMAQDFTLRYPLIDGQGNFGSRDGDGAAAMRYTECRLTPIAELLLAELDEGTVDFGPNYDGAFEEPLLLPARLPFVLLNGAAGIAVGMATEIPPHNIQEVAAALKLLIKKPSASLDEVLGVLPAPDFPCGAQIISPAAALREAYQGGRGSLRVRARWRVEPLARGQWRIIVEQLPPGVSTAKVLSEIEAAINPQPKAGKKDITQDEKNLKTLISGLLDRQRDESSENEPVRIVLEPKSSRQDPAEFMAIFTAHTSLEINVPINLTMVGTDGRPGQKGLLDILQQWIAFRYVTVERRTRHRLDQAERRIHILEGRMIAFLNIEQVIRVIRESDEPKPALIAAFGLTEIQAEDILEIRLRQLARLEGIRIEKELAELRETAAGLRRLLAERAEMTKLILKEIADDAKRFGDARRTLIEEAAPSSGNVELAVVDEPVTVLLSRHGWVRARQGHGLDPAAINWKTGDAPLLVAESRTTWPLVLIDTEGRAYSVRVADLPGGRGDGAPIASMLELQGGAKIACALSAAPDTQYLFANSGGYGFVASLSDLVSRVKAGKAFMTLEKGELVLPPAPLSGNHVAALATDGYVLVFRLDEMKVMTKGRGVIIMHLAEQQTLAAITLYDGKHLTLSGEGRGGKPQELTLSGADLERHRTARARRGSALQGRFKPKGFAQ